MRNLSVCNLFRHWKLLPLMAGFLVPMNGEKGWEVLSYRKIAPNKITFSEKAMTIDVNHSASPLVYRLPEKRLVSVVKVWGSIEGKLFNDQGTESGKKLRQGENGCDDFLLRIGLVVAGAKKLNFIQKRLAADWILRLYELAPAGVGIDHIHFLNVVSDRSLLGRRRKHPHSDLLVENFVWEEPKSGDFHFHHKLDKPLETLAIWIASDGDDLNAQFKVNLTRLEIE